MLKPMSFIYSTHIKSIILSFMTIKTNKNELVSVVMCTRNRPSKVLEAIQTVLNQSYQNLELIVVDGSDTNETRTKISNLKDSRIILLKDDGKGLSSARNIGIKKAIGKYICFQDDDCIWDKNKIEKLVDAISNSNTDVGVVYSSLYRTINDKKVLLPPKWVKKKDGDVSDIIIFANLTDSVSMLIPRNIILEMGCFDETLHGAEDWYLAIKMSKKYKFKFLEEPLFISYTNKDSITTTQSHKIAVKTVKKRILKDINGNFSKIIRYEIRSQLYRAFYFLYRRYPNSKIFALTKILL